MNKENKDTRYNKAHPVISFRITKDVYDKLKEKLTAVGLELKDLLQTITWEVAFCFSEEDLRKIKDNIEAIKNNNITNINDVCLLGIRNQHSETQQPYTMYATKSYNVVNTKEAATQIQPRNEIASTKIVCPYCGSTEVYERREGIFCRKCNACIIPWHELRLREYLKNL